MKSYTSIYQEKCVYDTFSDFDAWEFDLTSDVFVMQISHMFACHHYITPEKSFHQVHCDVLSDENMLFL